MIESNDVLIRQAEPNDFTELAGLYQKVALSVSNPAFFNWTEPKALDELKVSQTIILAHKNQILSFITYRELIDMIDIMALGTDPQFLKQGCLKRLLAELVRFAAQQNKDLWLEVHELNHTAINLYTRLGFKKTQTRMNYYNDGGAAHVFRRKFGLPVH